MKFSSTSQHLPLKKKKKRTTRNFTSILNKIEKVQEFEKEESFYRQKSRQLSIKGSSHGLWRASAGTPDDAAHWPQFSLPWRLSLQLLGSLCRPPQLIVFTAFEVILHEKDSNRMKRFLTLHWQQIKKKKSKIQRYAHTSHIHTENNPK